MKITRRTFTAGIGVAAIAATAAGKGIIASNRRRRRPNVILFIADDMRFDAAGFAGNSIIKTPHLDQLASEGFVFDNNFVTTSVCPVSRASIMTGDYALRHGVYDFSTPINNVCFEHSFPVLMQAAGYHTGFIGKWGIGGPQPEKNFNLWNGFIGQGDYYDSTNIHLTDIQTGQALAFLKNAPGDKPFLLVVAYKAPHEPLIPQPRFAKLYMNDTIPRAKTDDLEAAKSASPLLIRSLGRYNYYHSGFESDQRYQEKMKNYYRLITGIDESVGTIVKQLRHDKKLGDTNILFTSDNGLLEGEHGLEGKWCMYEESIRVPLVMRPAPNYFPDSKSAHLKPISLNIDISPTILAMASIESPQHLRGASLLPVAKGVNEPWRQGFYYEHPGWEKQFIYGCSGYRGTEWKYVRYNRFRFAEESLFNLLQDPGELNNLAGRPEFGAILYRMRQAAKEEKYAILHV